MNWSQHAGEKATWGWNVTFPVLFFILIWLSRNTDQWSWDNAQTLLHHLHAMNYKSFTFTWSFICHTKAILYRIWISKLALKLSQQTWLPLLLLLLLLLVVATWDVHWAKNSFGFNSIFHTLYVTWFMINCRFQISIRVCVCVHEWTIFCVYRRTLSTNRIISRQLFDVDKTEHYYESNCWACQRYLAQRNWLHSMSRASHHAN